MHAQYTIYRPPPLSRTIVCPVRRTVNFGFGLDYLAGSKPFNSSVLGFKGRPQQVRGESPTPHFRSRSRLLSQSLAPFAGSGWSRQWQYLQVRYLSS